MTYPSRFFVPLLLAAALLAPAAAAQSLRVVGAAERVAGGADDYYMHPEWAPEGGRLAFTSERYTGLFTHDLATGETTQVTGEAAAGFGFAWSADGTALLARPARFEGLRRLNAVTVYDLQAPAEADPQRLTDFRATMPALPHWSPDGSAVVLYGGEAPEVIPTGRPAVAGKAAAPVFVEGPRGVAAVSARTGTAEPVRGLPSDRLINVTASPNGTRLAFEVVGGNLYVTNTDGSGRVDLGRGHRPAWSPDGRWVVFMRTEDDGHAFTSADLWAARADGSERVRLTDTADRLEMNPAWSPDGARIAFDDRGVIYTLPVRAD